MFHLTFYTENGKHLAEVASLLAEMGKTTVLQPGREVKRLKDRHGLGDEDVFEAPPQVREKEGRHRWVATRPALVKMWLDGWQVSRTRANPVSPFPTILFSHLSFPVFFCFSCLRAPSPSRLLHIVSPAFCNSGIPPLPHGSFLLAASAVRLTVHVSTSKLAEPTRPAVEMFLFIFTTAV